MNSRSFGAEKVSGNTSCGSARLPRARCSALSRLLAVSCLFCAALAWCNDVAIGATKEQVIAALGKPDYAVGSDDRQTLGYGTRKIILVDGGVTDLGMPEAHLVDTQPPVAEASPSFVPAPTGQAASFKERMAWQQVYTEHARKRTEFSIRQRLRRISSELAQAEAAVQRVEREKGLLQPPSSPRVGASEGEKKAFRIAQAAYSARQDKLHADRRAAVSVRDRAAAADGECRTDLASIADCALARLEMRVTRYGVLEPDLAIGFVGFLGPADMSRTESRGQPGPLLSLTSIPGSPLVVASGFSRFSTGGSWPEVMLGVVEVVAKWTPTAAGGTRTPVFEIRPYVRDPSADDQGAEGPGAPATIPPGPANSRIVCSGSGFFVASSGYIVTNRHVVVKDGRQLRAVVVQVGHDQVEAKLVAVDEKQDLALLKVEGTYPFLPLSARDTVPLGADVYVIGYPEIGELGTGVKVTKGVVSSHVQASGAHAGFFQLDAGAYHGNSGGPVIGVADGDVLGVLTSGFDRELKGVNFAIPATAIHDFLRRQAREVADQLDRERQEKPKGWADPETMSKAVVLIQVILE